MSAQALLFALAGNVCLMGLVASLYRPVWFRANGRVPSRWKIGGIWLALCSLCVLLSLSAGFRSPGEAESVPSTQTSPADMMPIDIAVPVDASSVDAAAMDAIRLADEPMDAVREAAEAVPVAPPLKPLKPLKPARAVAPTQPTQPTSTSASRSATQPR